MATSVPTMVAMAAHSFRPTIWLRSPLSTVPRPPVAPV
jgi:hypothetical protein